MPRPMPGRYDTRILKHPEYHRSYHHYLRLGAQPAEAARLAYAWTERTFPDVTRHPPGRQEKVLAGVIVAVLAVFAIGFLANQQDSGAEDTAVPADSPQVVATPVPSPTTAPPTHPASPSPAAPSAAPRTTAPRPVTTRARPPAPEPPPPEPVAPQPPAPRPPTVKRPAAPACEPSYPDTCLKSGIGDYDCENGSGNGPNYVSGPIEVLPPDPFGLDRDKDGVGCED